MRKQNKHRATKYHLQGDGSFVIQDYNLAKPFANFFPGIAGQYGIPMWVFYVNRGQCISSFGVKDKDHAILEFFPANKSWQLTPNLGFRSFLKVKLNNKNHYYEPFHDNLSSKGFRMNNLMIIRPYDLTLKETNHTLGLDIEINYFPIPNDCFAALTRIVKIKNISRKKISFQFLDGLPVIVPLGVGNSFLKKLGRTAEAWMRVKSIDKTAAFYKLDVYPEDRPEVIRVKKGNFYLSFSQPVIDASSVFGPRLNFDFPYNFIENDVFKYPKNQISESRTPCAMGLAETSLKPDEEKHFSSLFGNIHSIELLNSSIARIRQKNYLKIKQAENIYIIRQLQNNISTKSSLPEFNFYCAQTYLDNIVRGGYPVIFNTDKTKKQVFYLYMRKHGDLERDYNRFQLEPFYFSQGNGNFRDIAQNRRNDVWFNPDIGEANLVTFFNLIQTDAFNPLIIKGLRFHLKDNFRKILPDLVKTKDIDNLISFLKNTFTPGSLIYFLEENNLSLKVGKEELLNKLMVNSIKEEDAQHKQEDAPGSGGFWTDHWTYCLDLLETYLELFPENLRQLLFEKREFRFFDNLFVVRPRRERYVFYEGKIRQLDSLRLDSVKMKTQKQRPSQSHWVRTENGNGKIYQTNLIAKLFCILVNKLASLDPFGCGIEMEANKPNWYDALNGLPALFGSSICETMELARLISFLKQVLWQSKECRILLFEELYSFLTSLAELLTASAKDKSPESDFVFWDKGNCLKEEYRKKTLYGITGKEKELDKQPILDFINQAEKKVNAGIKKAFDPEGNLYCTYFINQVSEYQKKEAMIHPGKFKQIKMPLFLEAQVHALRIQKNRSQATKLCKAVKKSQLYDPKLKMYKVTGNLSDMPFEIGRCRAFSRGWLENESIWLHMEYKYLLELLKSGLHQEFYDEFKNILVCFRDPKQYGRSILENSSFIVSSAFADKNLWGTGFVARLSGSTAEFLHIWRIINTGNRPFFLNKKGELNLRFAPVLAGWMFGKDKTYSFNFLGTITVTYHNSRKKNTFGKNPASIRRILIKNFDATTQVLSSNIIPAPLAEKIRSRQVMHIDIFLD